MRSSRVLFPLAFAAVVAAHLALSFAPSAGSVGLASLGGRVLQPDGVTPRPGVLVNLVDEHGELQASSAPTRDDGAFFIGSAPTGNFGLMVETAEGTFASGTTVDLRPGSNPPLALSLRSRSVNYQQSSGLGSGSQPLARWARWTIAGGIGVAALLVIADVGEDPSDSSASPF